MFELERRGYLQAGAFVPGSRARAPRSRHAAASRFRPRRLRRRRGAYLLRAPREAARDRPRRRSRADQPRALRSAKDGRQRRAERLLAGNICNTNVFDPADQASHTAVRAMFEEQVGWAVDAGVDFIIGETFSYAEEALIALDVIKKAGQAAVMTLAMHQADLTREDWTVVDACKRLADAGADVVGLNCIRGPSTMLPLLQARSAAAVKTHVAALPVPYRTTNEQPYVPVATRHALALRRGKPAVSRSHSIRSPAIASRSPSSADKPPRSTSATSACAAAPGPHHIRALAEAVGKRPPASKYLGGHVEARVPRLARAHQAGPEGLRRQALIPAGGQARGFIRSARRALTIHRSASRRGKRTAARSSLGR